MGVTMREIGQRLGVSTVTVSNALNGRSGVSESMRQKIRETAEEMGYQHQMTERQQLDVGVLIPAHYFSPDSFYQMLYMRLVEALSVKKHFVMFELLTEEMEHRLTLPNLLQNRHVDALILLGQPTREYVRLIAAQSTPVVFLDFYDEEAQADAVVGDSAYGTYRLTAHLIRAGHKDIAFVGERLATSSIMDRYLGFARAMIVHGLPIRSEWVIPDRDRNGDMIDFSLPDRLPSAFVCSCDLTASRVIEMLRARGVRVPQDVSVMGFDDHPGSERTAMELSTFRMDYSAMAGMAVKLIEDRCLGKEQGFGRVVIGGKPIYRNSDSTGPDVYL